MKATHGQPAPTRATARVRRSAIAILLAVPAGLAVGTPAHAADSVSCSPSASFYSVNSSGALTLNKLNSPAGGTSWAPSAQIGSGWGLYGRLLAGPEGRLYGIKSDGVYRYRYTGSGFENVGGQITKRIREGWGSYANAQWRDKITVDERGDFYLIDGKGRLLWSRYDEATSKWVVDGKTIATGWDKYTQLVAGTVGTLYARDGNGLLIRHRYDSASERWIEQNRQVGNGWTAFTRGLMSAGGDTIFGIDAAGRLKHYRFREDTGTWPVGGVTIGSSGWSGPNVTVSPDACKLTVNHTPAKPVLQAGNSPVSAIQAAPVATAAGDLHFAYSDFRGDLYMGVQDASDPGSLTWTADQGDGLSYAGQPTLLDDGSGAIRVFAQHLDSNFAVRGQSEAGSVAWNPWLNLAGALVGTPTAVRLTDDTIATFGVAADGSVWHRIKLTSSQDYQPWSRLAGTGPVGKLHAVAGTENTALLFGTDADGAILTARYQGGALISPWTSLGGTGFAGLPGTLTLAGPRVMVFARTSDGHIATQTSDVSGQFPGTWQQVGGDELIGVGKPAALINPNGKKLLVFNWTSDNTITFTQETVAGSLTFGPVQEATAQGSALAEPVALAYQNGSRTVIGFTTLNPAQGASIWEVPVASFARGSSSRGKATPFKERVLTPPTK